MSELKPCPFCGSEDAGTAWHHGYWSVRCSYWAEDNYPNRCNQDWGEFETEEQAIAAWNRRHSTARELSCEELEQMHGQPVWVVSLIEDKGEYDIDEWALIVPRKRLAESTKIIYQYKNYGKTWRAYTAPPKED